MAKYELSLEHKGNGTHVKVYYVSPEYRDAWVGARTVARMGTLFKDDPKCRNASTAREFWLDAELTQKFHTGPAAYIVRHIFAEHTRKKGKARMTTLTQDDLLALFKEQDVPISPELEGALKNVLSETDDGGIRITVAAARRLGLKLAEEQEPAAEEQK